ncbi:hypothetical protein GGI00_005802, partial [Coemansia sp. RSA 2681]
LLRLKLVHLQAATGWPTRYSSRTAKHGRPQQNTRPNSMTTLQLTRARRRAIRPTAS